LKATPSLDTMVTSESSLLYLSFAFQFLEAARSVVTSRQPTLSHRHWQASRQCLDSTHQSQTEPIARINDILCFCLLWGNSHVDGEGTRKVMRKREVMRNREVMRKRKVMNREQAKESSGTISDRIRISHACVCVCDCSGPLSRYLLRLSGLGRE
jgi:hypothetical protein